MDHICLHRIFAPHDVQAMILTKWITTGPISVKIGIGQGCIAPILIFLIMKQYLISKYMVGIELNFKTNWIYSAYSNCIQELWSPKVHFGSEIHWKDKQTKISVISQASILCIGALIIL